MAFYSRRHYRAVSPAADTKAAVAERFLNRRASELAIADRQREFPTLTTENADTAIRYQDERIAFHTAALERELRSLLETFPFRIVYAALNPNTGEYFASAVDSMRIPNKLTREGWQVVRVK